MAAIDAAPPARWAFVYPWCRVLRGKLHLEGRTAESSARWEYHWVAVRLPHSPEKADVTALRRIREALDLLARVAVVDNAAFRALLVQQCRVPRDEDDQPLDRSFPPRFRFVFNEKFVEPGALSPAVVCRRVFLSTRAERASEEYMEARRDLAEVETSLGRDFTVGTSVPYELQFELVTLPDDVLETHLRDVYAMLAMLQSTRRCEPSPGALLPLMLDSIRLDVGGVNMSWSLTQRLTRLLSAGLPFSLFAFSLKKCNSENYEQMQENVGHFLRNVVCGKRREESSIAGGVNTLSVGCHDCDEWQFAALCSAIGSACATKHLRMYGVFKMSDTNEVRQWKWQWLTYALFRTSTDSSVVRSLITAAQLTRDDTLAVAVAIHSNSPPTAVLEEVVPEEEEMLSVRGWRRDTCGQFQEGTELTLVDPGGGDTHSSSSIVLEADTWLHILNDEGDTFEVVLPGFGIVRVDKLRATEVDQRQQPAEHSSASAHKALTLALGLHTGEDGGQVLADFLKLVGAPLQSLALYAVGSYPISMASICQACPQLTDLFLEGIEIANPSDFCDDVERTKCKLTCLGLVNVFSSNDQITQLAETIAAPTSHIATHLSELGISGTEASCTLDDKNVQKFLSLLETNRTLTYLSLGMTPELQLTHDEAFQQHHGEPLPVVQDKFPLCSKIAFLSAVRGRNAANAANLLDDAVLSLVLSFAAICATRTVTIHFDD